MYNLIEDETLGVNDESLGITSAMADAFAKEASENGNIITEVVRKYTIEAAGGRFYCMDNLTRMSMCGREPIIES